MHTVLPLLTGGHIHGRVCGAGHDLAQCFTFMTSVYSMHYCAACSQVDTPMGESVVPDMNVVNRAKVEDLNRRVQYQVSVLAC